MAFIDEIAAQAAFALRSKNEEACSAMAFFFHQRFCQFADGSHAPSSSECTGLRIDGDGFVLSFGGKHLHYRSAAGHGGKRWCVSEFYDYEPRPADRSDIAVSAFSAPYSFLEGIAFCIECYEAAMRRGELSVLSAEVRDTKRELEQAKQAVVHCIDTTSEYERRLYAFMAALSRPSFVAKCLAKAATACECPDAPPSPPSATVSVDAARVAFKGFSGVYFLWLGDKIDYVGRANCISTRLGPSHHKLDDRHRVSIVKTTISDSWIVEPYYIWRYRPRLNCESQRASSASLDVAATADDLAAAVSLLPQVFGQPEAV